MSAGPTIVTVYTPDAGRRRVTPSDIRRTLAAAGYGLAETVVVIDSTTGLTAVAYGDRGGA